MTPLPYSLAKELKDAGFPIGAADDYIGNGDGTAESAVYVPTLSELIEACGDGFESLHSAFDMDDFKQWYCMGRGGFTVPVDDQLGYSTPEEAVARLWLALNSQSYV